MNPIRSWSEAIRPLPPNVKWVPHIDPEEGYDLAVLHVDQQLAGNFGKSRLARDLRATVRELKIPCVVVNHGTPFWPEQYSEELLRAKVRQFVGDDAHMVVNSRRALEMWGRMGLSSRAILHGIDGEEWKPLPKEPRAITVLSAGGLDLYYNRELLRQVRDRLKARGLPHVWVPVDWQAKGENQYEKLREFVGRSLVYFNPTLESPMPRARTEAMLAGCCVVTTANHGAELFIEDGVNGFHCRNNPEHAAEMIAALLSNPKLAESVGAAGRKTALDLFSLERYFAEWSALINEVLNEERL